MSAVLEWLKTFLMLYFFLTLILYLVPKKSYQKYLQFAVKMILLVVVFLPLLNRVSSGVDFFSLVEEFETYKAESGLTDMEGLEGLQTTMALAPEAKALRSWSGSNWKSGACSGTCTGMAPERMASAP